MTRHITAHKGGRTARAPQARIRPQTLQRIHAEMQERDKSFADLLEEQYGGNMNGKAWKMDVYQVVDGSDNWPLINTVYGSTKQECEDKAEELYGPNADDKHWTGAVPND